MSYRNKLLTLGLLAFACVVGARAEIKVGDRFPALDAGFLAGGPLPATFGKVTLVDFWASWCAPCKASFPTYAQLHTEYGSRGLVIVAVSVDESAAAFESFLKHQAPPFATLRDKDHQLVGQVKVRAMPTSYLIDRTGRVRFIHQGFHGAKTDQEIRQEINSLLAENPPTL